MANPYNVYPEPINRAAAMAGVGGEIQRQKIERAEAPLRQGLLRNRLAAEEAEMPIRQRILQLQATGAEGEAHSQEQRMRMLDDKLKQTNFAADAYQLLQSDDATMLQGIQQAMPEFAAAARHENATPEEIRKRLGAIVQRAGVLGLIRLPEAPKQPASVQEYEYAKGQGYKGTFEEFSTAKRKAGATNVNVSSGGEYGTIPPGYMVRKDPKTGAVSMEPIPGGPAARDIAGDQGKMDASSQARERYGKIVIEDIDRAIGMIEESPVFTTGLTGSALQNLAGSKANDLRAIISTVRANIGFDRLQEMRMSSPTGGALGPVSDFENQLLQATLGNLEQSQSNEQLKYNLQRVKDTYLDIVHGPGNRPEEAAKKIPEGIDPGDWEYMTPEERALFE